MITSNRSHLDRELSQLSDDILKLASLVEEALTQAMHALEQHDLQLAHKIIASDTEVNHIRYHIEEECFRILATQNPAATDLRQVIAATHIATELERIGDHAAGIAQLVERMEVGHTPNTLYHLPKMAKRAQKMMRQSIQAFITRDLHMAETVIGRDEKLDKQYGKFTNAVMEDFNDISDEISVPTYMLWMGHALERVGDRVTNIAERVIFMLTGEFVEMDF